MLIIKHKKDSNIINNTGYNNSDAKQIRSRLIKDINNTRIQNGLKPYKLDADTQRIANVRIGQANKAYQTEPYSYGSEQREGNDTNSDNWIHGMDSNQTSLDDAKRLHISVSGVGENAAPIYTGSVSVHDLDGNHTDNNYDSRCVADDDENDMVNHDKYSHNGHRENILNKYCSRIGVAVKFDGNFSGGVKNHWVIQHGAIVEEFR